MSTLLDFSVWSLLRSRTDFALPSKGEIPLIFVIYVRSLISPVLTYKSKLNLYTYCPVPGYGAYLNQFRTKGGIPFLFVICRLTL